MPAYIRHVFLSGGSRQLLSCLHVCFPSALAAGMSCCEGLHQWSAAPLAGSGHMRINLLGIPAGQNRNTGSAKQETVRNHTCICPGTHESILLFYTVSIYKQTSFALTHTQILSMCICTGFNSLFASNTNLKWWLSDMKARWGNIAIRYVCDLVHGAASDGTHTMPLPKYAFLIFWS